MYLIIKITSAFILGLWLNRSINTLKDENKEVIINKDSLVYFSKLQLGKNYNYANCSPKTGFDCSGFVYYVFTHFKVNVPRSSSEYAGFGKTIPVDSCITGDIIVFTGTNASLRSPGHVGIVLTGSPDLSFIHSSSDKRTPGVKISNFKDSPNYQKRFIKIVRVCKVI
jgi:cell wall-associated NlpC family hydrolase